VPKVLLVEDNELNRDMLGRRLQRHSFSVCFAVDGSAGVAMASSEKPDIILMDIALGVGIDGWEATRRIKADPATAKIPVIALTAYALDSDRAKSLEVGCADFETKPIDFPRLMAKIEACLNDSRAPG
jgi:CheY-like chemotaxis protein